MDELVYRVDGEEARLPSSFSQFGLEGRERGASLGLSVGDFDFKCYFHEEESQIEIDFWPWSVTEQNYELFLRFLADLGSALGKDLVVTPEMAESEPFLRYSFHADKVFARL